MPFSPIPAARCHYLLDLLAQIPDPRKRRGRRHPLAGLLAVGIAAVIAGSRSFAAIGQWAADAGPEALAVQVIAGVEDDQEVRVAVVPVPGLDETGHDLADLRSGHLGRVVGRAEPDRIQRQCPRGAARLQQLLTSTASRIRPSSQAGSGRPASARRSRAICT